MKLIDKVAGVTGSVRGLGWEMVNAFAEEGTKIVICDLDQAAGITGQSLSAAEWNREHGIKVEYTIE